MHKCENDNKVMHHTPLSGDKGNVITGLATLLGHNLLFEQEISHLMMPLVKIICKLHKLSLNQAQQIKLKDKV